jgi:hypothetical protein
MIRLLFLCHDLDLHSKQCYHLIMSLLHLERPGLAATILKWSAVIPAETSDIHTASFLAFPQSLSADTAIVSVPIHGRLLDIQVHKTWTCWVVKQSAVVIRLTEMPVTARHALHRLQAATHTDTLSLTPVTRNNNEHQTLSVLPRYSNHISLAPLKATHLLYGKLLGHVSTGWNRTRRSGGPRKKREGADDRKRQQGHEPRRIMEGVTCTYSKMWLVKRFFSVFSLQVLWIVRLLLLNRWTI